jgi:hypothetical protein
VLLRDLTGLQPEGHVLVAAVGAMQPPMVRLQPTGHSIAVSRVHVTPCKDVAGEVTLKSRGHVVTEGLVATHAPKARTKPVGHVSVWENARQITPVPDVADVTRAN